MTQGATTASSAHRPIARAQDFLERSALHSFGLIAFQWIVVVGAVAAAQWQGGWLAYLAAVWIIGGRMIALAEVIGHDSVHFNLFPRRSWNRSLEWLWFTPLFENWRSYREAHERHHAFLLTPADPAYQDFARWGLIGPDGQRRLFWKWFIRPFLFFDTWNLLRDIAKNWRTDFAYRKRVTGFWMLALSIAATTGSLELLFWYWLVPLLWACPALNFWSETGEHFNVRRGDTRNNFGWLEWLFISPHNDRYHAVHHRFPRIPSRNLAAAARALGALPGIETSRGFLELYRMIRQPPPASPRERTAVQAMRESDAKRANLNLPERVGALAGK